MTTVACPLPPARPPTLLPSEDFVAGSHKDQQGIHTDHNCLLASPPARPFILQLTLWRAAWLATA